MRFIEKQAWAAGVALVLICAGPPAGHAQEVPVYKNVEAQAIPPAQLEQPTEGAEGVPATAEETTAPAVVRAPGLPADVNVSPGLEEIIRLVQAGVGEDVLLAYIKNSTNVYFLGSEQVVYLNDLGVSSELLTALIERDNTPEALAHKARAGSAAPLPPGVALTTPATNIYLGQPARETAVAPAEEQFAEEPAPAPGAVDYATATEVAEAPDTSVNYFYDALAPYGSWVHVDGYGLCWQPTVAVANVHWRPYGDRGRWLWSSSGWYWYSDYTWGWAPFHYGRWFRSPVRGWVWLPGSVWGPSWVTWRYTDGYCGWAPLPPYTRYSSGLGLLYRNDSVHFSFGFGFGYYDYVFVSWRRFGDYYPYHHYVHGHSASVIFNSSRAANRFERGRHGVVNRGIDRDLATRRTGRAFDEIAVRSEARTVTEAGARPERLFREGRTTAIVRPQLPDSPEPRSTGGAGGSRPGRGGSGAGVSNDIRTEDRGNVISARPVRGLTGSAGASAGSSPQSRAPIIAPQSAPADSPTTRAPVQRPTRSFGTVGTGQGGTAASPQTRTTPRIQPEGRSGAPVIGSGSPPANRIPGTVARSPFEPVGRPNRSTVVPSTPVVRPSTSVSRPVAPVIQPQTPVARPQTPVARPQTSVARPQTSAARVFTPPPSSSAGQLRRPVPVFPGVQSTTPRPSSSVGRPPSVTGAAVPTVSRPTPVAPSAGRSAPSSVITRPPPQAAPSQGVVAPQQRAAPSGGGAVSRPSRQPGGRGER